MDTAELIRPQKEAAADGEPASAPAPAPAPTKKQKPVAAGVLGKASKPSGPLKVAPSRNTSSSVSTAPVGTRVADTGVRPGGGAAAALGGGAAAAPTFAQLQAQEERERKKREREERRAKAAAEAERSTVASTARSTTSDLPEVWGRPGSRRQLAWAQPRSRKCLPRAAAGHALRPAMVPAAC